ncbi:NAD(P)-binding protein [Calocera viscosa TUFC12733]|uniref:NAD(P)-binding protein n=1 Tax=Calocera viscosa (strain TUFC12733) TaxID=1330018 RepID=A0A167KL45_CALVF|nr:NAD(P)-binding protein [Calocera viscosa TUFC12733]
MPKKLVVVLGATGTQGASVITALLSSDYLIRAPLRYPSSPQALVLASQGIEILPGELGDKPSLLRAFQGAHAVFGVTVPFQAVSEVEQGKNIVDACKEAGVPLLVWSGLPSATEMSGGKYRNVTFFDEKAAVDAYIHQVGQPAVILHAAGYTENIKTQHQLVSSPTAPHKLQLFWPIIRPHVRVSFTYMSADFGPAVVKCIDRWEEPEWREKLGNEALPVVSYTMSAEEIIQLVTRLSGRDVDFVRLTDIPNLAVKEMFQLDDEGMRYPGLKFPPQVLVDLGARFHTLEDFVRKEMPELVNL